MRLEGKATIVTGGGGDIGRGIARCYAKEGARLLIVDLKEEAAKGRRGGIGPGARCNSDDGGLNEGR